MSFISYLVYWQNLFQFWNGAFVNWCSVFHIVSRSELFMCTLCMEIVCLQGVQMCLLCQLFEHVSTMFSWKPLAFINWFYMLLEETTLRCFVFTMHAMHGDFLPSWSDFIWFIRFEIAHGIIISNLLKCTKYFLKNTIYSRTIAK